jgi:hypothetical protein
MEGDARKLKQILADVPARAFDVVTNVWTSVGFYTKKDDLQMFKQARQLSRKGAVLFIAETAHSEYLSLKFVPTSFAELDDTLLLEDRKYDAITAQASTRWSLYKKHSGNLEFIDRVEIRHHVYNLSELSGLLAEAGWKTVGAYGSLPTLQPLSPLTHMNIVAKAI